MLNALIFIATLVGISFYVFPADAPVLAAFRWAGWGLLALICLGVLWAVCVTVKRRIQYAYFGGPHPSTYPDQLTPEARAEQLKVYPRLSTVTYGVIFATRVADFLQEKGSIRYSHRDYCGVGFYYENGCFYYDEVYDGDFVTQMGYSGEKPLGTYNREPFIDWLGEQSDESLCGRTATVNGFSIYNQRITKERLTAVLYSGNGQV
jgi:hypothetical protein